MNPTRFAVLYLFHPWLAALGRAFKLPMVNHKYFMLKDINLTIIWWYHDKSKIWYRNIDGLEPITYMPRRGLLAPLAAPLPSVFFMELRLWSLWQTRRNYICATDDTVFSLLSISSCNSPWCYALLSFEFMFWLIVTVILNQRKHSSQ